MEITEKSYFKYPSNLNVLDLATLVAMYRDRGVPKKAAAGQYFTCALNNKLIKEGKWWFGQYYSQKAWNNLLTRDSEGYPLTEVELNILGLTMAADEESPHRTEVEENAGTIEKLAFMIVNDLKEFGFLSINEQDRLLLTPRGRNALQGISYRIHQKKFSPKMLAVNSDAIINPKIEKASKKETDQTQLF
ncbi:MAG TPA: hypothetical protein VK106_00405 [Balneolaceae bacterium]|nr:hypothetical protein [Balneolaceae bacterium]